MRREMTSDMQAKLLYAAVGTAVDCGANEEQIKQLFSAKNIEFVLEMIAQKDAAPQGEEK